MDIVLNTYKSLEYDKILDLLGNFAKFPQSLELCRRLKPFKSIDSVKTQLKYTSEARKILDFAHDIPVEYIADVSRIKKNCASTYLSEQELIDCAKTMRSSRLLKNFISDYHEQAYLLNGLCINLFSDKKSEDVIFDTFDANGNIRQDASADLKSLYSSLHDTERNLKSSVSSLLNNPDFSKYLQDNIYTHRDDRIVFQVTASNKTKIPGIVHDVSSSAKTFYIEPEQIVPLNNKIRELQSKIRQEIIKILTKLTIEVKSNIELLLQSESIMAEVDFHFAKARYSIKIDAIEPEIVENNLKYLYFENMKHPLLVQSGREVVPNDFELGQNYHSIIVTGSNTGGKTVTLKTVGIFLLMAKSGMFLPCTCAKVYPFADIYADIGDSQSILENLSTFSSHMKNIIEILNKSDSDSLVLIDEICAGTDPVEGAILAREILDKLFKNGVTSIVTTHYGELKSLEYSNSFFKNASVEFNTETLEPTYKLLIGIPGLSNAISIASNLGLDKDIVERAKNILISNKDPGVAVVEQLQLTHQELEQNLEQAKELKESSLSIKKEYEENLTQIKKDKKKTLKNIKNKFDMEMLEARAEIKEILDELRKEKSEKIARRSYSRLAKLEQNFRSGVDSASDKNIYIEIDWSKVQLNDVLMLKNLNQKVKVVSLPDKNKKLTVEMGNMKMKVKQDELAVPDENLKESSKVLIPKMSINKFELKKYSISQSLDLRGCRVEEALDELEMYLDQVSIANLSPVTIIHGHGTGALKQAIRDYLSSSPYVSTFRPGKDGEGGDGVSVVEIK